MALVYRVPRRSNPAVPESRLLHAGKAWKEHRRWRPRALLPTKLSSSPPPEEEAAQRAAPSRRREAGEKRPFPAIRNSRGWHPRRLALAASDLGLGAWKSLGVVIRWAGATRTSGGETATTEAMQESGRGWCVFHWRGAKFKLREKPAGSLIAAQSGCRWSL